MKITAIIIMTACLHAAAPGYAQMFNLSVRNAPLEKIFKEIKKQSGYSFIFTREEVRLAKNVTINVRQSPLEDVLEICFKEQPLAYTIEDKFIIVRKKEEHPIIHTIYLTQQPIDVKGRVTSESGELIAGATVKVKGADKYTITDENGEFILTGLREDDVLIVSGAEIETIERNVNSQKYIIIHVLQRINQLDETLVIAYGKTTKRLNTGNVGKLTEEDISKQPVSDPLAALQGRISGLNITQSSGVPGSFFKVEIRGRNSLSQGSDPLFVIDGIPFVLGNNILNQIPSAANNPIQQSQGGLSPLNTINPSNIESIEILKDADATSIYGSRGANGVILITTKKGKTGKTKLGLSIYTGISKVTRTMEMLNTSQYLQMRREAFKNDGIVPTISNAADLLIWDTTLYTDFKKLFIGGSAHTTDAEVSIESGNANTQFVVGGGVHRETSVFPENHANTRGALHLNLSHSSSNRKFQTTFTTNFSSSNNNLLNNDLTKYINLIPNFPLLKDSSGKLKWSERGVSLNANPLAELMQKYNSKIENLLTNVILNYRILRPLLLKLSLGYNSTHVDEQSNFPQAAQNPALNPTGNAQFANSYSKSWIVEPHLEYNIRYKKNKLSILAGGTFQEAYRKSAYVFATGYNNDALIGSISGAGSIRASNTLNQYRYDAVFGRLNINREDKYIVNLSGRRDGSSRFGPDKQFANFGSLAGAWIFSNESFVKKRLSFLSFGKLRMSYGTSGNDQIGDYQYLDSWTNTIYQYQGITGLAPTRLFNPDYSWEINKKLEVALELGLLKDKIIFSTAFFVNRSSNQLISYDLPIQTGFSNISAKNSPATVENTGFEVEINSKIITSKFFKWGADLNLSIYKNKLISFPGLSSSSYSFKYVEGESLNVIRALHFLGVNSATGLYSFEDVDKDGALSFPNDYLVWGNIDPKLYGGFLNRLIFKSVQLDIFLEFKKQMGRNFLATQSSFVPGRGTNTRTNNHPLIVLNRWQHPGDITDIQQFTSRAGSLAYVAAQNLLASDGIYSDASYIRLKNIALSYGLPPGWLKKLHLEYGKLFMLAQNIFTITNYIGADPENQNIYVLPPLRTITLGIKVNF